MNRNPYSPCSRPVGNGRHLSLTSRIDTSMTYCQLITLTLKIISVRCIPLNLRSKTRRRATLLLPTFIYPCQSVGTVNFTPLFTTSVSILISILQTFRFRAAASHIRPHMAFHLTTHPIRQGLLLFLMFYSDGQATSQ